jgi:alpha-beta hydrolase superfamily lysophospholipase
MKKVWFRNSRGQRLCGILDEASSEKAVILLHGICSDKDEAGIFIRMAETLSKNGFNALRFDFAGSGESEGEFSGMSFTSEVRDMESAIRFMRDKGYGKIGLLGASFGGAVSILGHPKETGAMILWNPVCNMESFRDYMSTQNSGWREEASRTGTFRLYKECLKRYMYAGKPLAEEAENIDMFPHAGRISCPVLIIHGEMDSILPCRDSEGLLGFLKGPKKLEIIKNAGHGFHDPASEKTAIKLTLDWLGKYL